MIKTSVRVELNVTNDSSLFMSFTIKNADFVVIPDQNDIIHFFKDKPISATVRYRSHYVSGDFAAIVIHCSCMIEDEFAMMTTFDRFKDSTEICDLESNTRPPAYYKTYRILCALWGSTVYDPATDHPTALSELFRAMWVVGGGDLKSDLPYNIHQYIIEFKKNHQNKSIELLKFMSKLEPDVVMVLNNGNIESIISEVRSSFSSIRSVSLSQYPKCIRHI